MPAPAQQAQTYRDLTVAVDKAHAACDAARVRILRVAAAELGALPEGRVRCLWVVGRE